LRSRVHRDVKIYIEGQSDRVQLGYNFTLKDRKIAALIIGD
jgi:hypothetical protein